MKIFGNIFVENIFFRNFFGEIFLALPYFLSTLPCPTYNPTPYHHLIIIIDL